ncbi:CAP domain-containing protein [Oceanobacillus halotolerans]|uniref:CAP domain-containing protein n=1 Tax=Oceanobacillus halotolerans TaxID=2663380 RepID=UPI0013DBACBB|nr:CAP domain-containing protein [Oceanobacillus halotolerans]
MRVRLVFILILIITGVFFIFYTSDFIPRETTDRVDHVLEERENKLQTKEAPDRSYIPLDGEIYQWIGQSSDMLLDTLNEPVRKDLSPYGYTWWVYTDQQEQYLQFGIEDDEIKTIYATGMNLDLDPIDIGQSYDTVKEEFSFPKEVTYSKGLSSYTFRLTKDDLRERPLAKVTNDVFIQSYFDTFTDQLSSIRIVTADILLKMQPYEVHFRGSLPEEPSFTEGEWQEIESGMEQQIFDITNVVRNYHEKSTLEWEDTISEVAFLHSKDMSDNQYFSHYSLNGHGLKERLSAKDIFYLSAGENIAAQYPDAPAAMEGWLNSEGHREALLKDDYTHLGVGVYRFYFTQNFVERP